MRHAFSICQASSAKRRLLGSMVTATLAVAAILVGAGPAAAVGSGAGTFYGDEHAPDSTLDTSFPPSLCAQFKPTASVPLKEDLFMYGTLTYNGVNHTGTWMATFTNSSTSYWASPVGTFAALASCKAASGLGGYHVPSDASPNGVVIKEWTPPFGPSGATVCSGAGYYARQAGSVITIQMTNGTCGGTTNPSTVTWTGTEVACGPLGCPDLDESTPNTNADAYTSGAYRQS